MPNHAQVRAAVERTQDLELAHWTESEDSYVLRPSDKAPELVHHSLYLLVPLGTSQPMSVALVDGASGTWITSGHAQGTSEVLATEPQLSAQEVPALAFELLREHSRHQSLESGLAVQGDAGWELTLEVLNEGSPEQWRLKPAGPFSTLERVRP